MAKLRDFQKTFIRAVEDPQIDTVALSGPRGLGKTYLAAYVLSRCLTPGDRLHQPGKEYILGAASLEQARLTYGFIREALEPTGQYRWIDSATRLGATHKATNTKLRAISSNAKTSFGLVNVPLVVIDEPGALEIAGGQMLSDSLFTAQGKVGSKLKLVLIGTLAPMAGQPGHWWYDLVHAGSTATTFVEHFHGETETWDSWATIRKANPLVSLSADFRKKLLEERDAARGDTRLKARFLSYRLNVPSADESDVLLTVDDWARWIDRPVPGREGKPIVSLDLGGGRAWSSGVAIYRNGRTECLAVAPGIPTISAQEKRDQVPAGTYQRLVDAGRLQIATGLHVQPPAALWDMVRSKWGQPAMVICDRFRLPELQDVIGGNVQVEPRVSRWSEAAFDIRALRKLVNDGPFALEHESRDLLRHSLSVSMVKNDDQGNTRLMKKSSNNTARDDVSAALVLSAGAFERQPAAPPRKLRHALAG